VTISLQHNESFKLHAQLCGLSSTTVSQHRKQNIIRIYMSWLTMWVGL